MYLYESCKSTYEKYLFIFSRSAEYSNDNCDCQMNTVK